jgi:hypothetical protein
MGFEFDRIQNTNVKVYYADVDFNMLDKSIVEYYYFKEIMNVKIICIKFTTLENYSMFKNKQNNYYDIKYNDLNNDDLKKMNIEWDKETDLKLLESNFTYSIREYEYVGTKYK